MFRSPQAPSPFLKFWLGFRLFLDLFDLTQKTVEREFIRTVVQRLWQRRWPWWDGVCCGRTRWRRTRGRSSSALTRTCSSSPLRCSRWSRRGGAGTCQSLRRTSSRWEGWPPSWAAPATGWTWPRLGLLGSRGSSRTPWQQQKTLVWNSKGQNDWQIRAAVIGIKCKTPITRRNILSLVHVQKIEEAELPGVGRRRCTATSTGWTLKEVLGIGVGLPRMITQVIFTVFTFAFGISPRELARRPSGSSRAMRRIRASVKGTLRESTLRLCKLEGIPGKKGGGASGWSHGPPLVPHRGHDHRVAGGDDHGGQEEQGERHQGHVQLPVPLLGKLNPALSPILPGVLHREEEEDGKGKCRGS